MVRRSLQDLNTKIHLLYLLKDFSLLEYRSSSLLAYFSLFSLFIIIWFHCITLTGRKEVNCLARFHPLAHLRKFHHLKQDLSTLASSGSHYHCCLGAQQQLSLGQLFKKEFLAQSCLLWNYQVLKYLLLLSSLPWTLIIQPITCT